MKVSEISITAENQVPFLAKSVLDFCKGHKVFALYGDMGAGKTTLIKEICKQLGSTSAFSSPTYSIVNEYTLGDNEKIYHLDLYRLKTVHEAVEIGLTEYLHSGHYCFIEWPQIAEPLMPPAHVRISIKTDGDFRHVSIFIS